MIKWRALARRRSVHVTRKTGAVRRATMWRPLNRRPMTRMFVCLHAANSMPVQ
jgi:hypothetical protein